MFVTAKTENENGVMRSRGLCCLLLQVCCGAMRCRGLCCLLLQAYSGVMRCRVLCCLLLQACSGVMRRSVLGFFVAGVQWNHAMSRSLLSCFAGVQWSRAMLYCPTARGGGNCNVATQISRAVTCMSSCSRRHSHKLVIQLMCARKSQTHANF